MRPERKMDSPIDDLLRRLLFLGLPLIPLGCGGASLNPIFDSGVDSSSVADLAGGDAQNPDILVRCAHLFDSNVIVPRPDVDPDGGVGATITAWNACSSGVDCSALCVQLESGFAPRQLETCARVEPGTGGHDAGTPIVEPGNAGAPTVEIHLAYSYVDCTGRRPEGLVCEKNVTGGRITGGWLAEVSALEAASVPAFLRLAAELAKHGAPAQLVRAARRAAADEIRHAILTARAAAARGALPKFLTVVQLPVRSLLAVVTENAREGCVRETFGAITAAYQARHAADPELRALMTTIADDEARHAHLAWEVDAWARTVLPSRTATRLGEAKEVLFAELAVEVGAMSPPASLAVAAGLPSVAIASELVNRAKTVLLAA